MNGNRWRGEPMIKLIGKPLSCHRPIEMSARQRSECNEKEGIEVRCGRVALRRRSVKLVVKVGEVADGERAAAATTAAATTGKTGPGSKDTMSRKCRGFDGLPGLKCGTRRVATCWDAESEARTGIFFPCGRRRWAGTPWWWSPAQGPASDQPQCYWMRPSMAWCDICGRRTRSRFITTREAAAEDSHSLLGPRAFPCAQSLGLTLNFAYSVNVFSFFN